MLTGVNTIPIEELFFNFKGAKKIFMMIGYDELKDLDREVLDNINWSSAKSDRAVYDYMNTLKFLKAVDNSERQLLQHIFEGIDKCHNKTNISEVQK